MKAMERHSSCAALAARARRLRDANQQRLDHAHRRHPRPRQLQLASARRTGAPRTARSRRAPAARTTPTSSPRIRTATSRSASNSGPATTPTAACSSAARIRANLTDENCYEANIFDQRPDQTYATGAIVKVAAVAQPAPKVGGKWSVYEITAQGPAAHARPERHEDRRRARHQVRERALRAAVGPRDRQVPQGRDQAALTSAC